MTDCASTANKMSCDAMSFMAQNESLRNARVMDYLVNHPTCERFNSLADRGLEHEIQANSTTAISRKLCVTKTAQYGIGEWTAMMNPPLPPVLARFDEWTRSK